MPRQIGPVLARIEFIPVSAIARILAAIPLERAVRIGAHIGGLAARADRFNRPIGLINLEIAFPELDRAAHLKILEEMYRNWGRMLAEWTHTRDLNPSNIANFVTYEGTDNLEHALAVAKGGGGIVLTAHFGNFEWLPLAHALYGYRIAMIQRPLRNPLIDRMVQETRKLFGNDTIARKHAARTMLRYLRENKHIAVAIDLDVRRGVFVDFFGKPASTTDGVARLAMATGVPVVPAFMVRQGAGPRHRITVLPMVEIVKTRDREDAVRENTQRMTTIVEQMIRRYPGHWNWIHRRWKTRPRGEPRFY